MSKKIILVGPPGAGKTTLRKIFFEGEYSAKILDYGLEPTRGQESLILNLSEKIGIFDLGGQENTRWFETEDKSIFHETNIIIIVLDINNPIPEIISFIKKLVNIREELTPLTRIFILIHKIDLITHEIIQNITKIINDEVKDIKLIKVFFTSIKRDYITNTFMDFVEILRALIIEDLNYEKSDFYLLEEILKVVYTLNKKEFISSLDLQFRLNRSENVINKILDHLIDKGHVQFTGIHEEDKLFFLTHIGKTHFNQLLEYFTLENLIRRERIESHQLEFLEFKPPPVIGIFIMSKENENYLFFEINEGTLVNIIKVNFPNQITKGISNDEFIYSFSEALKKYIQSMDIKTSLGLQLKGASIYFLNFNNIILCLFSNHEIEFKNIENLVLEYFNKLYKKNKLEFDIFSKGSKLNNTRLIIIGKEWLKKLNDSYESMLINSEIFDAVAAKNLYSKLDGLAAKVNPDSIKMHEKIKNLKVSLMNCVLEENIEKLKKIANEFNDLNIKVGS